MAFRFRLARVLEWYERQYKLEASLLQQYSQRAADARVALTRQRESRAEGEKDVLVLDALSGNDLSAKETWRAQALSLEARMVQICQAADNALLAQRSATMTAQRRVRLVEKVRDRKFAEIHSQLSEEVEQAAADSYLAGFSRRMGPDRDGQSKESRHQ